MKITIDGKEIQVKDSHKNIVQIADENGISITAPCFRNKKKNGCCNACVIEVEGLEAFACATKPKEGMEIIYHRDDLVALRRERLEKYAQAIKRNDFSANTCSQSTFKMNNSCNCSGNSCN